MFSPLGLIRESKFSNWSHRDTETPWKPAVIQEWTSPYLKTLNDHINPDMETYLPMLLRKYTLGPLRDVPSCYPPFTELPPNDLQICVGGHWPMAKIHAATFSFLKPFLKTSLATRDYLLNFLKRLGICEISVSHDQNVHGCVFKNWSYNSIMVFWPQVYDIKSK